MARLPKNGCYVNPDGTIHWSWTLAEAHKDLEYLPPVYHNPDGSIEIKADPAGFILDLSAEMEPDDMREMQKNLNDLRVRTDPVTGKHDIKLIIRDAETGEKLGEIEHPAITIAKARKEAKAKKAKK